MMAQDPVVWEWRIQWNETAYQSDNSKGWKGINTMLMVLITLIKIRLMIGMVLLG